MNIYVSHGFKSRLTLKPTIEQLRQLLPGHDIVDPFYTPTRRALTEAIDAGILDPKQLNPIDIVEHDCACLDKCDLVVAILDGNDSYGTHMEMAMTSFIRKPLLILDLNNSHQHPWVNVFSTCITDSIAGLVILITTFNANRKATTPCKSSLN